MAVTNELSLGSHHMPVVMSWMNRSTLATDALSAAVPVMFTGPSVAATDWFAGAVITGVLGLDASWIFARFGSKTWIRSFPVSVT